MKQHPWYLIIMVFAFIVVGFAGNAQAVSSYRNSFNTTYPAAAATLGNCTLCHPGGNTNNLNPYANAYANSGYSFAAIEPLDSDGDGFTNIAEINALTYPGDATSKPVVAPPPPPPPVTVTLVSIAISGPATLNENGTATYAATATMSNNTTKAVTATWSENSTVTTISAAGVLTASAVNANQAVTVSASYTEGGLTRTATYAVTVVDVPVTPPPVGVTLTSLAISGPASVNENGTATYAATATMSNNTTKAVTATWSENSTATTISAAGVLTASAVAANQAVTVSASYTEGGLTRTATYAVTVIDVPVTPPPVTPPSTADSDSDGMTNGFELAYGLDPNNAGDAGLDPDGDGLSNLNEYLASTNPKNPDTDGDGFWDGAEFLPKDKNRPVVDAKGEHCYGIWFIDDGDRKWSKIDDFTVTTFGAPGMLPVVGDWDGDGYDDLGAYRDGMWYIDNGNDEWDDGVDKVYSFGSAAMKPVTGDWNGDGRTEIGAYENGIWYLDANGNGKWDGEGIDIQGNFGTAEMLPVAGDWDGDGKTEIGAYHKGTWYFDRNGNYKWDGLANNGDSIASFGDAVMIPVTADLNGDGKLEIGTHIDGTWYFDSNNNGRWDAGTDMVYEDFGFKGTLPIIGDWNNDRKSDIGVWK